MARLVPILTFAALLIAAVGAYGLWFASTTGFDFRETAGPAGFRAIDSGDRSAAFDPLAGLGGGTREAYTPEPAASDLCVAIFGEVPPEGVVPIAVFSDFRCPWCRELSDALAGLDDRDIAVRWHEWPIFGPVSEMAARAALAAGMQGAGPDFRQRLMNGAFAPTPAYLAAVAADHGLDAARLLTDMDGPEVEARLRESLALTRAFGFLGTPGLIVGRTVVTGAIPERALRDLVALERAAGPPPVCDVAGGV